MIRHALRDIYLSKFCEDVQEVAQCEAFTEHEAAERNEQWHNQQWMPFSINVAWDGMFAWLFSLHQPLIDRQFFRI